MAKGKKSSGKTYVSQGKHSNVSQATKRLTRRAYLDSGQRPLNQQAALNKGKDIVLTVPNPNKEETNRLFIKVRVSGRDYLNSLKRSNG